MAEKKEKAEIHIQYEIGALRNLKEDIRPDGEICHDTIAATIHSKEAADELIRFLKEHGFNVRLKRISEAALIDEIEDEV